MQMRRLSGLLGLLVLLTATNALAQQQVTPLTNTQYGVTLTPPEGWESIEGDQRAIFNLKHEPSQSQIEVIATQLMSADVAETFFDTFHETLSGSNFQRLSVTDETVGSVTGKTTQYRFEYEGVALRVVVFQFTREANAFLVVGYIKDDEFDTHFPAFQAACANLTFGG